LSVAAYLAKAGVDVGVAEARSFIGGGSQTRENTLPGFKQETDAVIHHLVLANPMITNDELGLLSKYGLEYIFPKVAWAAAFLDGSSFCLYHDLDRSCESIAAISPRDADAYHAFYQMSRPVLDLLISGMFAPSPKFGQTIAMLDSNPGGQEVVRALLQSAWDIVNEHFFDDRVKTALMKMADEAMQFPEQKGTGSYQFIVLPFTHHTPSGTPRGGGIALANSLAACIRDHGGEVYTDAPVTRVTTNAGRATGVLLASGDHLGASRAVVSGTHIKKLVKDMVDGFPEELIAKVMRTNPSNHSTLVSNYALNEAPDYIAGGDVNEALMVEMMPSLEDFRGHFDDCRYGRLPRVPVPYSACHSKFDDTKAPAGKHTIQLYDPSPYELAEGGPARWDDVKEAQEDVKLAHMQRFTTNMGDGNILDRAITSPLDLERYCPNYIAGDIMGIGSDLYQYMGNRPIPALGDYRTPIEGLYLCGSTSHPGGGVACAGRAVVQTVMEDLGIDFEKVIA
jgi:phytoene dehydrogenase-like protein